MKNEKGELIFAETTKDKADMLVKTFSQLPFVPHTSTHQNQIENFLLNSITPLRNQELQQEENGINSDITKDEILEAIKNLPLFKAQGIDEIHNQMIKNGGEVILDSLFLLFNWSYKIGHFPQKMETISNLSNTKT